MDKPRWFTPARMLTIFTSMSLLVYLDRGLIASTGVNGAKASSNARGHGIQGEFGLSNFQDGCLPAAFMVGLMVASPLFAEWSKRVPAFRLVGIGLGAWVVGVAACGLAWDFWSILFCRMLVGAGEASFVILAAPFIDDYAPPHLKSLWLAIFMMAIPVGYAFGYVYGGVVGYAAGWRMAFISEASLMLPFVIFASIAEPISLSSKRVTSGPVFEDEEALVADDERLSQPASSSSQPLRSASSELLHDLYNLCRRPVFVLAVLGNTMHTAVLGMYSYWGPKAVSFMFHMHGENADILFGLVTVLTGILGTLLGGIVLDRLGGTARSASAVCLFAVSAGFIVVQTAFFFCYQLPSFVAFFALGELVLFMIQSPVTTIILLSVPSDLRPLAFSVQTITIHVLGDVPSPPAAGWIHDKVFSSDDEAHPQSWRSTVLAFNLLFVLAIALFLGCIHLTKPAPSSTPARMQSAPSSADDLMPRGIMDRLIADAVDTSRLSTVMEGDTPSSTSMLTNGLNSQSQSASNLHSMDLRESKLGQQSSSFPDVHVVDSV